MATRVLSNTPGILLITLSSSVNEEMSMLKSFRNLARLSVGASSFCSSARSSPRVMPSLRMSVSVLPQRALTTGSIFSSASGERMLSGSCR